MCFTIFFSIQNGVKNHSIFGKNNIKKRLFFLLSLVADDMIQRLSFSKMIMIYLLIINDIYEVKNKVYKYLTSSDQICFLYALNKQDHKVKN